MNKHPALVGVIPRKNLWNIIQEEKWYHIPVESAPENAIFAEYLGFYFPSVFDKEMQYKVNFYAKVKKVDVVKRIKLFPKEKDHKRANNEYLQFHLEKITELSKPIPSNRERRIIHIPTSCEKLFTAREINDLYNTSPLEEKMYLEMKKREITPERQFYVKIGKEFYCLDFGIFCKKGKIDLECDGEKYHTLPESLTRDRERNNELTSFGWRVLRFSGNEISKTIKNCFVKIERTIGNLGGISGAKVLKGL